MTLRPAQCRLEETFSYNPPRKMRCRIVERSHLRSSMGHSVVAFQRNEADEAEVIAVVNVTTISLCRVVDIFLVPLLPLRSVDDCCALQIAGDADVPVCERRLLGVAVDYKSFVRVAVAVRELEATTFDLESYQPILAGILRLNVVLIAVASTLLEDPAHRRDGDGDVNISLADQVHRERAGFTRRSLRVPAEALLLSRVLYRPRPPRLALPVFTTLATTFATLAALLCLSIRVLFFSTRASRIALS